jgi:hypothetical protein
LAASSPTLHHTARTIAICFGPTAEPDSSVTTGSLLGETSLLGFAPVCRHSQSKHGSVVIEISSSVPTAQGRHRYLALSIVCLRQRVLSLNPQVAFIVSNGRLFYSLPRFRFYCASMITARTQAFLTWFAHSAKPQFLFPVWIATPLRCNSIFSFTLSNCVVHSALTHSSNCRSVTDCVRSFVPNRNLEHHSVCSRFLL